MEWNRRESPHSITSEKIGLLPNSYSGVRNGDHKPEGVVFVSGPGVPSGPMRQPISALDFAPTLARLLDVPLPEAEGECIACIDQAIVSQWDQPVHRGE